MPAEQRGEPYKLGRGRYGLRYRDRDGVRRRTTEKFPSRTAALNHYRDVIAPELRGDRPRADLTLRELVAISLTRHAATGVRERTIATLRDRLGVADERDGESPEERRQRERHAIKAFGDERLIDLEHMADELAGWRATLPPRAGHGIMSALRQVLEAGVRWEHMTRNPAKLAGRNPKPPPRIVRAFTRAELDAIAAELSAAYRPLPTFAATTGLRPEEWGALERRDIDGRAGVLNVQRTISSGVVVELGKTSKSRRQVPLAPRALAAVDAIPARLDTPLIFPSPAGALINPDNFRRREWAPAITASGVAKPARIYDLRSTFASNALAARVDPFEVAQVMGTSLEMLQRHYGVLLPGSAASIAQRLAAFDSTQDGADERASDDRS
jgi:integrase